MFWKQLVYSFLEGVCGVMMEVFGHLDATQVSMFGVGSELSHTQRKPVAEVGFDALLPPCLSQLTQSCKLLFIALLSTSR